MKQHKWHKEIKAWADGAEIERRKLSAGIPWESFNGHWAGLDWEYRIKLYDICKCKKQTCSALKEPQYLYVYQGIGELVLETSNTIVSNMKHIGKIKLEVDDD